MSNETLSALKDEADSIYQAYQSLFAGQPRATRDPAQLEALITRLRALLNDGRTLLDKRGRDPALSSVLETARENLQRYNEELSAIKNAQANPFTVEAARLASRANRVFDTYNRHFAGQSRETRDFRLLEELIDELRDLAEAMKPIAQRGVDSAIGDLDTVESQIGLYEEEIDRIRGARATGTQEEQASRLAHLANAQFALYNAHFAGRSRTTRRPELLHRMIANLEDYQRGMKTLAQSGHSSQSNRNNIGIVSKNLDMYRDELKAIKKVRADISARDLAGALGGAANEEMALYREHYAGKDRRGRDLEQLGTICDELRNLQLQMLRIADAIEIDFNTKNIGVVEEARSMYEAEWRQINEVSGIA